MGNKATGRWKDALLKTSLPLELLVAEKLRKQGYFVTGEFTYARENEEGKETEFSVDVDAFKLLMDESDSTWAAIHLVAECKYNYPGVKWVFSPYANEEAATIGLIGNYHSLCVRRAAKWGPYDGEENLPYCFKGIELHEDSANPQAVTRALGQVQYALPWVLYQVHRVQAVTHHDEDVMHAFVLPVVITTAELYVLNTSLTLEDFQGADSIVDVARKVSALVVHRQPGVQWSGYVGKIFAEFTAAYPEVDERLKQLAPLLVKHGYASHEILNLSGLSNVFEECANHVLVVQYDAFEETIAQLTASISATYNEFHQVARLVFDPETATSTVYPIDTESLTDSEPQKTSRR